MATHSPVLQSARDDFHCQEDPSSGHSSSLSSGVESPSKSPTVHNLHIAISSQPSSSGIESPGSFTTGSDSPASSVQSPPTPLPHTPLFSPQHHPLHAESKEGESGTRHDLSEALLQAGWRKCYSKREQRWYFFNKLTQQSTWEEPELGGKIGRKRTSSEMDAPLRPGANPGKQTYKKFIPSSDWNLSVHSNLRMAERIPFSFYPPHPDIEAKRLENTQKLRMQLQELCHGKDVQDVPLDTFNRWLVERKCDDKGRDPLISSDCDIDISPSLLRDLLSCIPIRQLKISTIPDARRQLSRYAESARRLADSSRHVTADQRKQIKWHCQAMFDWLRQSQNAAKFDEYLSRLKFLRQKCHDILIEAARPTVEQICSKMNQNARETALKLQEEHRKMLSSCGIDVSEHELPPPRQDKIVTCYSAQLRFGTPQQPLISQEQTPDGWVRLKYKQDTIKLNATHFFKLCLFGPSNQEALSLQRSLPVKVFEILTKDFGTSFEGFASPLNSYYRQFCSMFPDTDGYFGSRGSFLELNPLEGSMVLNPPFSEELITACGEHVIRLLRCAESASGNFPMSFVVFLPDWHDPPLEGLETMEYSGFCRVKKVAHSSDHFYRHGGQHWIQNRNELHVRSPNGTIILVLQNNAGMKKWPVSEEKLEKVLEAFRNPNGILGFS